MNARKPKRGAHNPRGPRRDAPLRRIAGRVAAGGARGVALAAPGVTFTLGLTFTLGVTLAAIGVTPVPLSGQQLIEHTGPDRPIAPVFQDV